jgi:hypothetical protein
MTAMNAHPTTTQSAIAGCAKTPLRTTTDLRFYSNCRQLYPTVSVPATVVVVLSKNMFPVGRPAVRAVAFPA